jgi:hypothetical protein
LIFDGTIAVNASGDLIAQLAAFRDERVVDTDSTAKIKLQKAKHLSNFSPRCRSASAIISANAISIRQCWV